MSVNYFAYAVPLFIGAMVAEAAFPAVQRQPVYALNDTFANLVSGLGSQLVGLYLAAVTAGAYAFVFDRWRVTTLPEDSVAVWVLGFLAVDLAYYWFHRTSHEVNFLWASHIVHHQSEEYNLSVALRQSWFGGLFAWFFYLPLAALGLPLKIYLISYSLNLVYQFIIHTKTVGRLGILEWVMNTPSHHRVHHGSNIGYLDRNYAGTLIIWDRLFGTFIEETVPVEYGLVKPLRSWNPVWANLHYWVDLARASRAHPALADKARVWVKNPGWMPGDRGPQDATLRAKGRIHEKFRAQARLVAAGYVLVQFAAAMAGTIAVMVYGQALPGVLIGAIYASSLTSRVLWEGLLADPSGGAKRGARPARRPVRSGGVHRRPFRAAGLGRRAHFRIPGPIRCRFVGLAAPIKGQTLIQTT